MKAPSQDKMRVVLVMVSAIAASSASAQVVQWTGAAEDSKWESGANWSSGSQPACAPGDFGIVSCNGILIDTAKPVELNVANSVGGTNSFLVLGNTTTASIVVGNGGVLTTANQTRLGGSSTTLAGFPLGGVGGHGTVEVRAGGRWIISGVTAAGETFRLGDSGTGILTITGAGSEVTVGTGGVGRIVLGYAGTGFGTINIGAAAGQSAAAAGKLSAGNIFFREGGGRVVFNHIDTDYTFGAAFVSGTKDGAVDFLSGTTILTGNSDNFFGTATVGNGGTLAFSGNRTFGNRTVSGQVVTRTSQIVVENGGALSTIPVSGDRARMTLTIRGDLTLSEQAKLYMGLGDAPAEGSSALGISDLIIVQGNLVLGGTLNIGSIGNYGSGTYEIFNFGGNATGEFSGIVFPDDFGGTIQIDNANNRVLLTVGIELGDVVYWQGGDGVWSADPGSATWTGWTDAGPIGSGPWNGQTATFRTSAEYGVDAGVVSLAETVDFRGIDFLDNGFRIEPENSAHLNAVVGEDSNTAVLSATNNTTGVIAAGIIGDAGIRKAGAGTIVLSGNNSWTGGTIVSGGVLQIGEGGTTGTLPGNVTIEGGTTALAFNRSNSYTYAGVIGGNGQVRQNGSGTTILSGNNGYGATQVNAGTLQIGAGGTTGTLGTGSVAIAAGATLVFNRSNNVSLSNTVTGAGSIVQRGGANSMLTLSGTMTNFTGSARAESGLLTINSTSYNGAVTVMDGGVLGGVGRLGSVIVQSGGRLAPGNSIGTLTVTGAATFQEGSFFEVESNATGQSDRLVVLGTANLNGNVVSLGQGAGWRPRTEYVILTANTLSGTFQGAVEENLAFLDASLIHNHGAGTVTLRLDRNDIAFQDAAVTENQYATAVALQTLSPVHPVFNDIFDLLETMTPAEAQTAYQSMSGEIHASVAGMLLDDSRLVHNAVMDRAFLAPTQQGSQLWMKAIGHQGSTEGDGVSEFKRDAVGLLIGFDSELGDSAFHIGWAAGYHMNTSVKTSALRSEGEANNTHAAIYGGMRQETGLGVRMGISHTWHEIDIDRTIMFSGYEERVSTGYDATTLQAFGEVDYRQSMANGMEVAPFLSLAWAQLATDKFIEADFRSPIASTAGLRADDQKHDASFATLGARGTLSLGGSSKLQGLLGYRRVLSGEDPAVSLRFLGGSQNFDVRGAPVARDALLADVGIDMALGETVRIGAAYNGQLASDAHDHAIEARLVWTLE